MNCLDPLQRQPALAALEEQSFDLLIIGGGITGAGILHEAGKAGLRAALLEADDFAAGTSSRSTKLIHGGLRYLAMGQVRLVAEAARQRQVVHRLAAHLAQPAWLMLPARSRMELWKYRLGVTVYETLGQVEKPLRHYQLAGRDLLAAEPSLDTDLAPSACVYTEYLTDDARLVLANIRSGVQKGGLALNHIRVEGFTMANNRINGVLARCQQTGAEVRVAADCVINAAGPWVEAVAHLSQENTPKPLVLSRGVHIVVPYEQLPLKQMSLLIAKDKRPIFAIPRGNVVYIGTTDTLYNQAPEIWPETKAEEVTYLLEVVNRYYGRRLERLLQKQDVLTTWAGLRPLIFQQGKNTKEISRRDEIWVGKTGLVTIAGGKLTGYGQMAREVLAEAARVTGMVWQAGRTNDHDPLPGGDFSGSVTQLANAVALSHGIPAVDAERLVRLYGADTHAILQRGKAVFLPGTSLYRGEISWGVHEESASNLVDMFYRRTRLAVFSPGEVAVLVAPVAEEMAKLLGWSVSQRQTETDALLDRLAADRP